MDTVFFIINGTEVYVCDYYKDVLKAVKFKDKDFWEMYDVFDFKELIEYMNYPCHYNHFKGSRVVILYAEPTAYETLWNSKEVFERAEVLETDYLGYSLRAYFESEGHSGRGLPYYINFENMIYKVSYDIEGKTSVKRTPSSEVNELTDEDLDAIIKLSATALCGFLLESQYTFTPFEKKLLVLSPVTLEKTYEKKEKQFFLETHFVIEQCTTIKDKKVTKGDSLFHYIQYVHGMFGKTKKQTFSKKADREGIFFSVEPKEKQDTILWAEKGQVVGVIGEHDDTREAIYRWLEKIGY